MKVREFETVTQARHVLGQYTTAARLSALESLGINLENHTHKELAVAVCATREKVTMALLRMGRGRGPARKVRNAA